MTKVEDCTRIVQCLLGCFLVLVVLGFGFAPSAMAAIGPVWNVQSVAAPTVMRSSDIEDQYIVNIENIGDSASTGVVTLVDKLPPGVTTSATPLQKNQSREKWVCTTGAGQTEVTCTSTTSVSAGASESYNNVNVSKGEGQEQIFIPVTFSGGATGQQNNEVTISGGSAASVSAVTPNLFNGSISPSFGLSYFDVLITRPQNEPVLQAGGHPYAVTASFGFNKEANGENAVAEDDAREIAVDLPLGLVGNPLAVPRCPLYLAAKGTNQTQCPPDTQVGMVYLSFFGSTSTTFQGPFGLFNVKPEPGHPGEFVFDPVGAAGVVLYGTVVRTKNESVVRVVASAPRAHLHDIAVTFFGNPGGLFAPNEYQNYSAKELPFLINPTNCDASETQRTMTIHADSWQHPPSLKKPDGTPDFSDPAWREKTAVLPTVQDCSLIEFENTELKFAPNGLLKSPPEATEGGTTQADVPSAFEGRLRIPQVEQFGTPSKPELKNATVTLPEGLSVSPSAADGLEGCSEEEFDLESGERGKCPEGSTLGTVEVMSPLIEEPLEGHVYLAEPRCGEEGESACLESEAEEGKLFGLDMELEGLAIIKLPGKVEVGGYGPYSAAHGLKPGQLRAVFENNPQIPFEELRFKFKEGPRTPLANPQTCGTYTTTSLLEPWSAPYSSSVTSESSFNVDWDGKGGACPSTLPFAPALTAGTQSQTAGAYSPLVVRFERKDREQDLSGITVHTPSGLLGNLSGIPLCGEAQANAGSCSPESEIGTVNTAVGPGSNPFWITVGHVYLTGPYKTTSGAQGPFGLSIVVPANAGPFHLGNVIVRASIQIDPHTATLTVTSNPLPQIVFGVPIRIRTVEVNVNRPAFTFNATTCVVQHIEATLTGLNGFNATTGSTSNASYQYAANGCAHLPFKPAFGASTGASTASRKNGASLNVKLSQAHGEADIGSVKVELPRALPARLETLQKACTAEQFNANPAGCPAASKVGTAIAHTPILPVPIEGPAYFVSHGGEAFPELILVLQGDGVTIDLAGETFINEKTGVTSSSFKAVPDAPVTSFELSLPTGRYSALGSPTGSLCGKTLRMPTTITGQNGRQVTQSTKITTAGCSKVKTLTRAQKLKQALNACHKLKNKTKRHTCEKSARKRYGPIKAKKTAKRAARTKK